MKAVSSERLVLTVNGRRVQFEGVAPEKPLLWVLRDQLRLNGAKFGCGHGGCGACMVQVDGQAVTSCNHPIKDFIGKSVTTIEAIAARDGDAIIRSWLAEQVPQCGYCQPGMIVAADALLARNAKPSDADIDAAMSPVLCRCGTYPRVRRAIHRAAARSWNDSPFPNETMPAEPRESVERAIVFNPWVKITRDGTVIVVIGQSEMGQGVTTSLPMLVAEELETPLDRVAIELGPADHAYDNPIIHLQITVGSLSIQTNWERMRRAGAEVRERLIAAAAAEWRAPASECQAKAGRVTHLPTGRSLAYGALAESAATLPVPRNPPLKAFDAFTLLGKPTARRDIPAHVAGRTIFGADVRVAGTVAATIAMPPVFGAKFARMEDAAARAVPGVRDIVKIPSGVAVVADDIWSAMQGREALRVSWQGGLAGLASEQITQRFRQALARPGAPIQENGDAPRAIAGAATILEAEYETPYLAHAPIEPINCTARIAGGLCEVWVPTQSQTLAQQAAAEAAGLPPDKVRIHTTYLGGGFGRRSVPDVVTQAVEIAKAIGKPVQLMWTRAEDMHHDRYRPASLASLRGGLDESGNPIAWLHRVAGPELAGEGLQIAYDIPNLKTEHIKDDPGVPTGYWRSVGASQNAFAVEGFMDELAAAAGIDPVEFRLRRLGKSPRLKAALAMAAEKSGWGEALPAGRTRGVAAYYAHGGWAAQVAEISIAAGGAIKLHRIVCAADCGFIVNPDTAKAQLEGAIVFGLTAALKDRITIADGRAEQSGFRDYPLLTMAETPPIDIHLLPSREAPTGAGECGVPPVAPAIANAVFAATGKRIRRLPILKV